MRSSHGKDHAEPVLFKFGVSSLKRKVLYGRAGGVQIVHMSIMKEFNIISEAFAGRSLKLISQRYRELILLEATV